MNNEKIYAMPMSAIFPLYVAKAEKKGRSKEEARGKDEAQKTENKYENAGKRLSFAFPHSVSDSDFRINILRFCRIEFQLSPDMCHIDPQDLVVAVCVGTPDSADDIIVGKDFSGLFGQKGYQLVFDLG